MADVEHAASGHHSHRSEAGGQAGRQQQPSFGAQADPRRPPLLTQQGTVAGSTSTSAQCSAHPAGKNTHKRTQHAADKHDVSGFDEQLTIGGPGGGMPGRGPTPPIIMGGGPGGGPPPIIGGGPGGPPPPIIMGGGPGGGPPPIMGGGPGGGGRMPPPIIMGGGGMPAGGTGGGGSPACGAPCCICSASVGQAAHTGTPVSVSNSAVLGKQGGAGGVQAAASWPCPAAGAPSPAQPHTPAATA